MEYPLHLQHQTLKMWNFPAFKYTSIMKIVLVFVYIIFFLEHLQSALYDQMYVDT